MPEFTSTEDELAAQEVYRAFQDHIRSAPISAPKAVRVAIVDALTRARLFDVVTTEADRDVGALQIRCRIAELSDPDSPGHELAQGIQNVPLTQALLPVWWSPFVIPIIIPKQASLVTACRFADPEGGDTYAEGEFRTEAEWSRVALDEIRGRAPSGLVKAMADEVAAAIARFLWADPGRTP